MEVQQDLLWNARSKLWWEVHAGYLYEILAIDGFLNIYEVIAILILSISWLILRIDNKIQVHVIFKDNNSDKIINNKWLVGI